MKPLLKPVNLTERVHEHIKELVQTEQFPTTEPVFETQLAAQLGVSRTPVREALKMLVIEGYLESQAGGGFTAYPVKPNDLADVLEVRIALEEVTVRLAAQRSTPENMARIDSVMALTEKALDAGNFPDILSSNEQFHRVLASVTGTRFLEHMVDRIYEYVAANRLNRNFGASHWHLDTLRAVFVEHSLIAEAVRSRDPDRAASLMREHLKEVGKRYARNLVENLDPGPESSGTAGGEK